MNLSAISANMNRNWCH